MEPIEFHKQLVNLETSLEKFAHRLTSEKADAKDLLQETYLKVLSNQDKYVNHVNFKAWTFTIMKNTFINNYRRKVRQKTQCDQSDDLLLINRTKATGSDDPDAAYGELEITQNIEQLNDLFQIPFKMLISGYKYKEIADILELKIGTVKSRIFLSRKQLMDRLNK